MRQKRLTMVNLGCCILWLWLCISIVQVPANSASSNKQAQRWPLSSPGKELEQSHSPSGRQSLTGHQHPHIQQHQQHHRQKKQAPPILYGTMHCYNTPGSPHTFTVLEPYWNGDVNFFQIPRNPVTQQYEANMTCELYFSKSLVSIVYVEFTSCPLQGVYGDSVSIYELEDPALPPEPLVFFEDPVQYGSVDTQLSYLDLTFSSDGNSQAVGCSGFFVTYLPGMGFPGRKKRSDSESRGKNRTKRLAAIQGQLLDDMRLDCPTIPEILDKNSPNPLCKGTDAEILAGQTCTGVATNPIHDHIYMQLLRCSSLQLSVDKMIQAFCNAIMCGRYHSMCHVDFFDMHCGICDWLHNKYGATGSPTRFGVYQVLHGLHC